MSPEELSGSENTHAKRTPIIDAFLNASDPAAVIAEVDAVTIEDPDLLMEVVMAAPQYFNVLFTVLRRVVENFEMLPANLTTGALTAVGEDLDLRELGMALTSTFKLLNKIHQEDPGFIIRMLEKPINDLLDNVDAGELKELVDGWADDPGAFMTMLNDALWKNPAKLVSIFAAVPGIVNALIAFISELLRPMLDVAPELLAEIILQIVAGVRGKDLGQITNRLAEVVRLVHTGNNLLGGTGKPLLQKIVADKLHEASDETDPVLLAKARIAFAEDAQSIRNAIAELTTDDPRFTLAVISASSSIRNPRIHAASRKLSALENVSPQDLSEAVYTGTVDLDTSETADLLNTLLRLINGLHEARPDLLANLLSSTAIAVDAYELEAAGSWLVEDAVQAVRPIARAILPSAIRGLAAVLKSQPGEDSGDLDGALASLRDALKLKTGG